MGQWQAEVFLSGAGPRGTGINEPVTGVYNATCVDSERTVSKRTGRPGTILKLRIDDAPYAGMVMQQSLWDAKEDDKDGAKNGMTSSYKAALIGLGHDEATVVGINDKRLPMNQSHFEGRKCAIWVEASDVEKGWDFPDTSVITPTIAAEIKGGSRVPRMNHTKQNPAKAPVGAAVAAGGLLTGGAGATGALPSNGAGNPLQGPPSQGGGGAQLDSLLG